MSKKLISIALVCFVVLGTMAFITLEANADNLTVGVSLLTREHEFYRDLEEGLEDMAEELDIELMISSADFDLADQMSQVEDFIVAEVDAIVVCPVDSEGVVTAVESANEAGIPVFTADIASAGGEIVSHIASDNAAGGRLAAKYIADRIDYSGNIAIIDHPYVSSIIERGEGFREVMDMYPEIEIVAEPDGGAVRGQAMSVTEDVLIAHDDLDAIWGCNADSGLGALAAIEAAGRDDEMFIVGFDATPEEQVEIKDLDSAYKASPVQFPYEIGQTTLETIDRYFAGEDVEEEVEVEMDIYFKAVLDYFELQ